MAMPIRPNACCVSAEFPNCANQASEPSNPMQTAIIMPTGTSRRMSLLGVIRKRLRSDRRQPFSLILVAFDPPRAVDQKAKQERAFLVAQACLGNQAAELDFLARVFPALFRLACLSHALKPRYLRAKPRQTGF